MSALAHKGYTAGPVEYDPDARIFHGEVLALRDVVTFQGRSVDEIERAFRDSVDDYLEFCAAEGDEPEKPYSGFFTVRTTPELHRLSPSQACQASDSTSLFPSIGVDPIAHFLQSLCEMGKGL